MKVQWVMEVYELAGALVNIYPNPASDLIYIQIKGQLTYQFNIYNLEGVLVKTDENNNQVLLQDIPEGIYFLELINLYSRHKHVERIVVNRH